MSFLSLLRNFKRAEGRGVLAQKRCLNPLGNMDNKFPENSTPLVQRVMKFRSGRRVAPTRSMRNYSIKAATISSQKYLLENQREQQLQQIQEKYSITKNKVDVLIIGGGATGAGAALDATTRNLSTILIERSDFGNETSSRSTKLIWAGIRYIGTAVGELLRMKNITQPVVAIKHFWSEFKLVLNCHKERNFLLKTQRKLSAAFWHF
jgi:hypothetical protein